MRARKLKYWTGNLDGVREGFVAAYSQKEAAATIGGSVGYFSRYWVIRTALPTKMVNPKLHTLYTRISDFRDRPWVVGRCEVKRGPDGRLM